MTYKEALFFVGQCLTINQEDKNRVAVEAKLNSGKIDWEGLVKVSTAHYVFPALYINLQQSHFLKYVPEDLVIFMEQITQLNRERNTQIIEQAKEINTLLISKGITPIFLKGTGNLLEGLYTDIGERMLGDIDFIVDSADFLKTVDIVQKFGYQNKNKLIRHYHWHYPALTHSEKIASVEIHYKILKDNFQQKLQLTLFNELKIIDSNIHVLSDKNKILATSLPKIINDNLYHNKNIILRNAYDLFLLSKSIPLTKILIPNTTIHKQWVNYHSCLQFLFPDSKGVLVTENKDTKSYQKSYLKLLEGNALEKKKVKLKNLYIFNKNRLLILQYALTKKAYRKFVVKRIFQWDLYKNIFKTSNITPILLYFFN